MFGNGVPPDNFCTKKEATGVKSHVIFALHGLLLVRLIKGTQDGWECCMRMGYDKFVGNVSCLRNWIGFLRCLTAEAWIEP
jgi:hypothetical protein